MVKNNDTVGLFKWILIIAVAIILLSLGTSIGIALFCQNPAMQLTLFQTGIEGFKMSIVAVLGLLGGRSMSSGKS